MWEGFCQRLRDCGRDGKLFFFTVAAIFAAAMFWENGGACFLAGLFLLSALPIVVAVREQRNPSGRCGKFPPLSRNEWQSARSKLLRQRNSR